MNLAYWCRFTDRRPRHSGRLAGNAEAAASIVIATLAQPFRAYTA